MFEIFAYQLTYQQIFILLLCGFLIGMAKAGVHGTTLFAVPLLALIFGGKASSGLMLPMLIMADLFAVRYYHRHANWHFLIKLFPSAAIGVVIATLLGNQIDDQTFKQIMAVIIFASLGIMIWMETAKKKDVPDYLWFAALIGVLGGFTTMIGNLAGSVMALYLLSMRLPKNAFIGTAAWFFLIINLFKVPFHVFSWQTITLNSSLLSLLTLPVIALGAFIGIVLVKQIAETHYRWLVLVMTAIAAIFMLI